MKLFPFILLTSMGLVATQAQELPVGTQAENVQFSLLEDGLTNTQLSDFSGQVVVFYFYTPW